MIKYDPTADAVYVRIAGPEIGSGQTDVNEQGVIVDVDANGHARGFEFLSVRSRGLPTEGLPPHVAQAIETFISSGALEADEPVEREFES